MSATSFSWKFDSGYAELLDTAFVELKQKSGPSRAELQLVPRDLFTGRKNLELRFSLGNSLSGSIPSLFGWTLNPESEIKVTLIPEGKPFLGNFRVPEGHYAVQWKIIPTVSFEAFSGDSNSISAFAGSHLTQCWVEIFPDSIPCARAISDAWKNCVNPFNAKQAAGISARQVVRWNWTGIFRVTGRIGWSLENGWVVESTNLGIRYAMPFSTGVLFQSKAQLSNRGHFHIQISKKNNFLKFSIIRDKEIETSGSTSIEIKLRHAPILSAENKLFDPLLAPAEKAIKDSLARKLRLALTAESSRWHRKKRVFAASWKVPLSADVPREYSALLSGEIPAMRDGFSAEGRFDNVNGRKFSIKINILNRITGFEKENNRFDSVIVDPGGNLLFEKGISKTDIRYKWDETEFIRLAFSRRDSLNKETAFSWQWQTQGRFSRKELSRILKTILQARVIPAFTIPGNLKFTLDLQISTFTEFSDKGIEIIRAASPSQQWETFIRALEIFHPRRYRKDSFWRDWIDCPEVRHEITRNPVHCHLDSCYPVRGRTEMQRRQVTGDYRRALRFMELMHLWHDDAEPVTLLEKSLDFPLFLYFQLLCPPAAKYSTLTITGDWETEWKQADQ